MKNKFKTGDIVKVKENLKELLPDHIMPKVRQHLLTKAGTEHVVEDFFYFKYSQQNVYKLSNGDGFAYNEGWLE